MYIGILALKRVLSGRASGIKLKQITFTDDEVKNFISVSVLYFHLERRKRLTRWRLPGNDISLLKQGKR